MVRRRTQIVMHLLHRDECKVDAIYGRIAVCKLFSSHLQNATVVQFNFYRKIKNNFILKTFKLLQTVNCRPKNFNLFFFFFTLCVSVNILNDVEKLHVARINSER